MEKSGLAAISASLAAASVVAITQILTLTPHLDWWLNAAVWCFAVSLPLLIALTIKPIQVPPPHERKPGWLLAPSQFRDFNVFLLVCGLEICGFALVFFHFGMVAGVLFVCAAWIGLGRLYATTPLHLLGALKRFVQSQLLTAARNTSARIAKFWRET